MNIPENSGSSTATSGEVDNLGSVVQDQSSTTNSVDRLNDLLADGQLGEFAALLGMMSKDLGMSTVAERSGIARESLYKALRVNAQLRLDTAMRVLSAHGLKLIIVPK